MLSLVRVLFIAYQFPPVGGAGVQRVTKFIRYLPAHGITPIVLTVSNPSVPVIDESLLATLEPRLRVERVRTMEPGYGVKRALGPGAGSEGGGSSSWLLGTVSKAANSLIFPDPQMLWLPAAARAIARLAREKPGVEAVVITAPPFSQLMLVPWIQKTMRVPIVIDYRDEWETTLRAGHDFAAGNIKARIAAYLEKKIVTRADAVTTATEEFRSALLDRLDALDPRRVHFLPNGWDADDLPKEHGVPPEDRFRIAYAGTVLRLTSLRSVIGALRILHAERPELAACVELVVYGRIASSEETIFDGSERLGVRRRGYLEHRQVLFELTRSHLNLCVLDEVEGADRIYPAKVFELMALRRRTLVVTGPGALERLARHHRIGDIASPPEPKLIARIIERHIEAWQAGLYDPKVEPVQVNRFERRVLAGELARILREQVEKPRVPHIAEKSFPGTELRQGVIG